MSRSRAFRSESGQCDEFCVGVNAQSARCAISVAPPTKKRASKRRTRPGGVDRAGQRNRAFQRGMTTVAAKRVHQPAGGDSRRPRSVTPEREASLLERSSGSRERKRPSEFGEFAASDASSFASDHRTSARDVHPAIPRFEGAAGKGRTAGH